MFRVRFGEDADAYDRTRPVAPEAVFDDLTRLAQLPPGSTVAEIGPGTGQATRRLAERGLRVLAVEIDPRLAERARRNLSRFSEVAMLTTSFERWDPGRSAFDAVFGCNSFHCVDPDVAFPTFGVGVGLRRARRRGDSGHSFGFEHGVERRRVLAGPVVDDESELTVETALLHYGGGGPSGPPRGAG